MLRVAEHFERTDTGRQRRGNEDAFYARAPLFAVADGMGGAQAGEVASHLAVEVLEQGLPDGGGSVEERLRARVTRGQRADHGVRPGRRRARRHGDDAHRRLRRRGRPHRRPRRRQPPLPPARRGLRAPDRRPLARRGARAPGQAHARGGRRAPPALDHHARARRRGGRRGRQPHVGGARRRRLPDLLGRADLDDPRGRTWPRSWPRRRRWPSAGRMLIDAANDAGGRDNITVVLFRLEEVGARRPAPQETAEHRAWRAAPEPGGAAGHGARGPACSRAPPARERPGAPAPAPPARPGRPDPRPLPASPACSSARYYASQTVYFVGASNDGFVTRLSRTALRPAGGPATCTRSTTSPARRSTSSRRPRSRRSPSTRCAPRTTRRTSSTSSRPGSWRRDDQRAQPRAARAGPGVAAADGGLRGGLHRAQRRAHQRLADLRRDLPRPVPGGARRAALHAALRRPLPVPALRRPGLLRPGDDLPHRREAGARAGAVVRHRAGPLRRDDHPAARLPRARALPLHGRRRRHRAAAAAAPARDRLAGQRRLPRRQARPADLPAGGVRQDRDHRLPGQLPARHAPAAGHRRAALRRDHDPAAQALRAAARSCGARRW